MRYRSKKISSFHVYTLSGEVTAGSSAEHLMLELREAFRKGEQKFIFDLEDVNYVNSSGIGVLMKIQRLMCENCGILGLVNTPNFLVKIMLDLDLIKNFRCFPSVEAACEAYG